MLRTLQAHLTYANVMSTIAVFVALGLGTAWALERNSVESKHIAPDAVKGVDTKEASLSGFKCAPGTRYHAGTCFETASRPSDDWLAANNDCTDEDGRLPTVAELQTFRHTDGITLSGGSEWSNDYWRDSDDGGAELFWARTLADAGSSGDEQIAVNHVYRCAFAPS
jgi:hypothetical protein